MAYFVALIALVVFGLLAHWMHLEKGGTGDDAHNTNGKAWILIGVILFAGMIIGTLPGIHGIVQPVGKFIENTIFSVLKPAYDENATATAGASASAQANGASASGQAQVGSLRPSKDGIRLMDENFPKITLQGRKLTNFVDVGPDWYWCVVDPSVSATAGQDVVGGEYEVTDSSVTSVTIFLAKKVGGSYEFGDRRTFTLR